MGACARARARARAREERTADVSPSAIFSRKETLGGSSETTISLTRWGPPVASTPSARTSTNDSSFVGICARTALSGAFPVADTTTHAGGVLAR